MEDIWRAINSDSKILHGFSVKIPVRSLKSETDGLDDNMYKSLNESEFKQIEYKMSSHNMKIAEGNNANMISSGELTIAGTSHPIDLSARIILKDDYIVINGEKNLKMTDFGVTPPSLFFGMIEVYDEILIRFHLKVILSKLGAK